MLADFATDEVPLMPSSAQAVQPTVGRSAGPRFALVLGLGLAAVAVYTSTLGSSSSTPAQSSREGFQSLAEEPVAEVSHRRVVEGSLAHFIDGARLPRAAQPGASLSESAAALFDYVVTASSIDGELTVDELGAFKQRFVAAMQEPEDSHGASEGYFLATARKSIDGTKPVMTEALAKSVNSRQASFKVRMRPWMLDESVASFQARLIKVPFEVSAEDNAKLFSKTAPRAGGLGGELPQQFSAAELWPKCKAVIERAHDQGKCGNCWVFGAAGAVDSRLCIFTDGAYSGESAVLSRGYATSCSVGLGCMGGFPHMLLAYISSHGLPSTSCVPYENTADPSLWHSPRKAPPCPASCDSRYPRDLSIDLFLAPGMKDYQIVEKPNELGIEQLKQAIYNEGPVPFCLAVGNEFIAYESGVLDACLDRQPNHAVQALGWGEEAGKTFVQAMNSWGSHFGEQGKFKVAHCAVLQYVIPGKIHDPTIPALLS